MIAEIKVLNLIRAIAAFIVVISHYSNTSKLFNKYLGSGAGQIGVMIFFVLSGFLISLLYLQKEFNQRQVFNYLISRIARVVPLFLFVVLLSYFSYGYFESPIFYQITDADSLVAHLLFLRGVSVLWTIPVEVQFYLLFIFLWFLYKKNSISFFIFAFVFILIGFFYQGPALFNNPIPLQLLKAIPYFITGVLFAYIYKNKTTANKYSSPWWGLSFIFILILFPRINDYLFNRIGDLWSDLYVYIGVSVFFYCWVFLTPKESKFYSSKLGDFLGLISYSVYLWHLPLLYAFKKTAREHDLLFLPLYLILLILISTLSYKLIESPTRKFIKNYLITSKG